MNVAPGINEKMQGTCHGEVSWHHGNGTARQPPSLSALTVIICEALSWAISGFMKLY